MPIKDNELRGIEDKLTGIVPVERIRQFSFSRVQSTLLDRFRSLSDPTPTISDILDQLGVQGAVSASVLSPITNGHVVAGQVVTIRYISEGVGPYKSYQDRRKAGLGDRDAYAVSEPGDIVVMDNNSRTDVSTMGGLSTTCAQNQGLSACIVDGGVRDVGLMRQLGFPVWSRGRTPITGKFRVETIEINGPVQCAGIAVNCGDLAVADDNGVTFIPFHLAETVLDMVQKAEAAEAKLIKALGEGQSMAHLKEILSPEKW